MKFYLFQVVFVLVAILDASPDLFAENTTRRVVFEDDFENGLERWQILDPNTWSLVQHEGNHALEITARSSGISHRFGVPVTLL